MTPQAVEEIALASFTIVPDGKPDADAVVIPLQRKSDESKTGRARFAGDICEEHPGTSSDFPCAKFSQLPGKGKGVKQPSAGQIIIQGFADIVKPLVLIGVLVGSLYGVSVVYHGRGNLLRSHHSVSTTNPGLSDSGKRSSPSPSSSPHIITCSRVIGNRCLVSDGQGLAP